jgi:predicted O-methyltransferase YrrM
MSSKTLFLNDRLYDYMLATSVSQLPIQRSLCEVTRTMELAGIESSPEQVQFIQLLVRLMGAKRCLEVGVFTGYSTLSIAQALPPDGYIVACDIDEHATKIACEYWKRAGVLSKIDLRLAPAVEVLDRLLAEGAAGSFDFAYIDADKGNANGYYERVLQLLDENCLMVIDNVFWGGRVADPAADDWNTRSVKALNAKMCCDDRVEVSFIPLGDGLALARKCAARADAGTNP